jgi:NADH-quinone oxidoreductase subunit J
MFGAEFLGLLFVMVYVGAVAVLFLFVVMMINTKKSVLRNFHSLYYFIIINICIIVFINLFFNVNNTFFNSESSSVILNDFNFSILRIDTLSNIQVIGQALYNNYILGVLLAGFVLLIALIGSISLTINFKKEQVLNKSYKQLSRTEYCIHKFK